MSDSIKVNHRLNRTIGRLVFLAVLLPSISAIADSTTAPANEPTQANRAVAPDQPIQRKYTTTAHIKRPDTHRVYKDDYERLLVKANKAEPPAIIWLKQSQHKQRKAQTEESWLKERGRTD